MFVLNVQSVSLQHMNWGNMKLCIQKSDAFAVVYVMQRLSVNMQLWVTSRHVHVFVVYLNNLQTRDVTGAVVTFLLGRVVNVVVINLRSILRVLRDLVSPSMRFSRTWYTYSCDISLVMNNLCTRGRLTLQPIQYIKFNCRPAEKERSLVHTWYVKLRSCL